jgi:hypothetical protein
MRNDTRTPEEKAAQWQAKIDALHEKLKTAVAQLVTGDDWRRAMEFTARFRSRSWNNSCLIWAQNLAAYEAGLVPEPYPTYVAGFHQWKQLGRSMIRGSHGFQILSPVTARMAGRDSDPDSWHRLAKGEAPGPGEIVRSKMVGVRPAAVFPLAMTEGRPIDEVPAPKLLEGEAPAGLWDGVARIIEERGFRVLDAPDATYLDGANGMTHWLKTTVHVRLDMDPAQRVRTLLHEAGHVLLHDRDNVDAVVHRGVAEVEAESVALMVTAAHYMDSSQYTVPYVSTWASRVGGKDPVVTVQETAARVRSAALTILDRLDTHQIPDGTPPAPAVEPPQDLAQETRATRTTTRPAEGISL